MTRPYSIAFTVYGATEDELWQHALEVLRGYFDGRDETEIENLVHEYAMDWTMRVEAEAETLDMAGRSVAEHRRWRADVAVNL